MKIIILSFLLFLTACTDKGSGTTNEENPAGQNPPTVQSPTFSAQSSSLFIKNQQSFTYFTVPNEPLKISVIAKDQFGNLMSNIASSIKVGIRFENGLENLAVLETSSGNYSYDFSISKQGTYEVYLKVNGVEQLTTNFNVSYCNANASPSASPFHLQTVIDSKSFFVICNSTQLSHVSDSSSLNKNFILGSNIDLENFYIDSDSNQIPDNQFKIGPFSGEFNGNGYAINHFKYIDLSQDNIGLFSEVLNGASIKNLIMTGSKIRGQNNVGTFIGRINLNTGESVNMSNLFSATQDIESSGNNLGMIIGYAKSLDQSINLSSLQIYQTLNFSNPISQSNIGGIIGYAEGVVGSGFSGNFTVNQTLSSLTNVGSIIGQVVNSTISNSGIFSNLTILDASNVGCLFGNANNSYIHSFFSGINCTLNYSGNGSNLGGLFGIIQNNSSIVNINPYISMTSSLNSAGFVYEISDSSISRSSISGSLNFSQVSSGFFQNSNNSSFDKISNYAQISTSREVSGFGYFSSNSSFSRISNKSTIQSTSENVYSFLANVDSNITIENIYSNSTISSISDASFIGSIKNSSGSISNSMIFDSISSLKAFGLSETIQTSSIQLSNLAIISNLNANVKSSVNQSQNSTISSSNLFKLSKNTGLNDCLSGDSCSGIVLTDTSTASSLSVDLSYYNNSQNSPMNNWDFSTIWTYGNPVSFLKP